MPYPGSAVTGNDTRTMVALSISGSTPLQGAPTKPAGCTTFGASMSRTVHRAPPTARMRAAARGRRRTCRCRCSALVFGTRCSVSDRSSFPEVRSRNSGLGTRDSVHRGEHAASTRLASSRGSSCAAPGSPPRVHAAAVRSCDPPCAPHARHGVCRRCRSACIFAASSARPLCSLDLTVPTAHPNASAASA